MKKPNVFSRQRGSLLCSYELEKRQLRLKLSGVLTPTVMPQVAEDINRIGSGALCRSFVLDVRGAAVALTYEQLLQCPERLVPVMRTLPVSIICQPGIIDLWRSYAWDAAKLGLLRGAFAEEPEAQTWAGLRAEARPYSRIAESAR